MNLPLDLPARPMPDGESDCWFTPRWLTDAIGPVDLDPCGAEMATVKARRVIDLRRGGDGLAVGWGSGRVFVNCPYSDCSRWVSKCRTEAAKGATVLALVPAKPGEKYWGIHVWPCAFAVGFFDGRIAFSTGNGKASETGTFGSALVLWADHGCDWPATIDAALDRVGKRVVWVRPC